MTVDFLAAALPDWSVVEVDDSLRDWLQRIVYLR